MPLTRTPRRPGSRRRLPPAAALIPLAALLAGCGVAAPHAHADGHQLTVEISNATASPTDLAAVPFTMNFSRAISSSTLDASDISASSGTVQNLRAVLNHSGNFGGPGSGNGSLSNPTGVAVDGASGSIYVADGSSNRVMIFDPGGNFTGALPGGFNWPTGVAVNGSGSVYVVDYPPGRIAVFDSALRSTANITRSGMEEPYDVAVDGSGNVYVLESGLEAIMIFNSSGAFVGMFSHQLWTPLGVAVNASGYIYVANTNHDRVDVFDPAHGYVGALPVEFDKPKGVAADSHTGTIYVADTDNDRVVIYDPATARIGYLPGSFNGPTGVAAGPSGEVYVADMGNNTVQAFYTESYEFDVVNPADRQTLTVRMPAGRVQDPAGNANEASNTASIHASRTGPIPKVASGQQGPTSATTIGFTVEFGENVTGFNASSVGLSGTADHAGVADFAGAGGSYSFGVSPASDGTLLVDIRAGAAEDALGKPSRAAKRFSIEYDGTPPAAAVAAAQPGPTNLAAVPFVLSFSEPVNASSLEAGDVSASSGNVANLRAAWRHNGTFGGPGTGDVQFDGPAGMAVDASGNIYVADRGNNRVQVLDSSREHVADIDAANATGLSAPHGVAIDGATGRIYVADTDGDAVRVYHPNRTYAADLPGPFSKPTGVAVGGPHHRVHVAERDSGSVHVYDPDGAYAGNITGLGNLSGVAVDASGSIYVPRAGASGRVSIYHPDMTHAADLPGPFGWPAGVAVDASGRIYAADSGGNSTVRVYGPAGVQIAEIRNSFNQSHGVAIDPTTGALYVAEDAGNRIQAFDASYDFDVENPDDLQTLNVSLPAGRARDAAGNGNAESNTAGIEIDRTRPIPAVALSGPADAATISFAVTFDEDVAGFNASGIALSGAADPGSVANFALVNSTAYTFDASPSDNGTVTVGILENAAEDDAGNGNEAAQFSVNYAGASPFPVPTITSGAGPGPARESPIGFTVTFSEDVTGFNETGIALSGTAGTGATVDNFDNASARTYTFDVAPLAAGTVLVDIPEGAAVDSDGNYNEAAEQFSVRYTGALPVPTITSGAGPGPTSESPIGFTVTFSEDVTGFSETGIEISGTAGAGAAVDDFDNASARTYTFDVVTASDGTVRIDIPAGIARDADGNGNEAAAGLSIVLDTAGPAAAVAAAQAGPTNLAAVPFAVKFSEGINASALSASDIAASSGTVQDLRMVLRYNHTIGEENLPSADPGKFDRPFGLAVDGSGYLYVAERAGMRIQVFDPAGNHNATFGGPAADPGDPDPGLFDNIYGIAVDASSGRIYAADSVGDRVLAYDHNGEYLADLPGAPETPVALAVNASGHVYVSNAGNGTVQIFDPSWNWAAALSGAFDGPRGVAFDGPAGLVYAADRDNSRIRVFDTAGMPAGDFGTNGSGAGQFVRPVAVAVDDLAGRIYVAERGNHRVQVFDSGRSHVSYLFGFPNALDDPRAVAADAPSGRVYVADTEHHRVLVFDAAYEFSVANPDDNRTLTVSLPAGRARDAAGNGNAESNTASIEIDRTRPIPTVALSGPADAATISFAVTFGEDVAGFNASGIALSGSADPYKVANFALVNSTTYTFDASPSDNGTVTVDIRENAAEDDAGNGNEAAQFSVNYTGASPFPVPTITSDAGPGPARESPIGFTVTFSENVTGFNETGIALSGPAGTGATVDNFDDASARTYTFDVAPLAAGTVLVDIPEGAAVDSDGNGNTAAQFSIRYTGALPVPTITSDAGPGPTSESPIGFTVTFSENVTGFNETGIALSGPAGTGATVDNFDDASARTYTFDVAPLAAGTVLVDIPEGAAVDSDGNGNEAAEQFSIRYTGALPVPTITSDAGPGPARESPIGFTVTFSEDVTGFNETGIALSGPAGTGATVDNFDDASARTYTFDVAPLAAGTVLVDIPEGAAVDSDGNGNEAAEQFSIRYTGALPVPTITSGAGPGPARESPIGFTVTFSEDVTGFNETGIALSGPAGTGATVDNFDDASARTYTFDVAPLAAGTVLVDIPEGAAVDSDGNANEAAEQFSIRYTGALPVPTITSGAGTGPTSESPIGFTVTFSEDVTGFNETGIALSGPAGTGATVDNFDDASARTYTFDVAPLAAGTVLVDIPEGAAVDSDGNANEAAAQFSIEYAGAAPPATQLAVESAAITGPESITIRYDADADATGSAYHSIVVGGTPRSATLTGAGTDAHVLRFGGDPAARDATGTVAINQTAVTDPAGRPFGNNATYQLALADGQAPALASAVLDLTAGENGLLTLAFDEAVAAAPDAPLFAGDIVIRGDGGEVALSGSDVPSVASGRAGGTEFALDISGAKRVELNAADLGPAAIELPAAFVSDAPGNAYAPGRQPVPLAYAPDPSPPRLAAAAFNLAPAGGAAGRLVITFDEAATAPGAESFPGMIEIRGRSWGGDAAVSLSADDVISVESGSTGDRTFALLASDRARSLLDAAAFSDPESTTLLLPAGFVTNGRAAHAPERAPLDVARDPDRPSFLLAFVLNGSSVAAVYSEPVLAVPSHYTNITVDGAAAAGNGSGASGAAAFGNNVVVSWNANASTTAAAGSAVGFDLSANVTDAFGNPVVNPGEKSTGGPDGTGQAGKRPVQVGVFARGAGDPSMGAARLGAAAFNAVSSERGYQFYVNVSEHDLPAGAPGAAALRGAHGSGEGPLLYVGPASDIALADMAGYASENGITIISHSSAARSLAVGGDPIFRMEPGAAHMARALATEVARGGYGAIVPVVQAGLRGPDYGLLESLESDLGPLGIPFGDPVAFAAGGGGAAAAPIGDAVAAAAGSGTARSVAVVYMGSDAELVAMAGSVPADGPVRERSAWFAAGGAGAGAGSGVAASPAITADAAAMQLARDTRLSAVQFAVERNGMTDYIDRIAAPLVPATSATPAYAAYEAVRALGGALVGAGGDPSLARGNIAGAANLEGGPLGRTGMDGSGDLRLPVTYGIWSVSDAAAEWARAPELLRGLDACGIDLEKSALALPELSAGSTSRPARQTVTNIGTGPMPAVSVSATDWTQFLNGVPLPGPLPFSYTEMAVGLGGASPRPADSTPLAADTAIPGGTPPGGSVDVDFRINLEGLDALEADIISQTVTFVANCA